MKQTLIGFYILLFSIAAICMFYNYPAMLHLLPQGSHLWRQADCLAMMQNYQQFQLDFFQPATYNLQSVNGNVAGEFPVLYFIAAQFKNAAFVLRFMHTFIFLSGMLATYFISFFFLQRRYLSVICSLLLFTSPLLIFYGNNFLSDVPALSVAFIGWAFFLNGLKEKKNLLLLIAFLCFAFAGLLKASEMMNLVIAFILTFKTKKINPTLLIPYSLLLIPLAWYYYAKQYNLQNYDHYYFLTISPIWKLSLHDIGLGVWRMVVSLSNNYFWRPTSVLLILSVYFLIRHWKRLDTALRMVISTSFAMVFLYVILFYQKMIGHEYYYTPFFIFILFALIGILKTYNFFHAENVFTHAAIFLFLIPNLIFCKNFVAGKLTDNLPNGYLSSEGMQIFLEKNGVTEDKILISLPDDSPNKTLSQLKRKGYTQFNDYMFMLQHKKADYMLLGLDCYIHAEKLKPYATDSLGNFNGIILYKLK
ncbi:MAG TPA: hypothetical protein PLS10_01045 [Chitinophagales bacterium]|nr:hypothetical protein [Chitinophagales bacterium]